MRIMKHLSSCRGRMGRLVYWLSVGGLVIVPYAVAIGFALLETRNAGRAHSVLDRYDDAFGVLPFLAACLDV